MSPPCILSAGEGPRFANLPMILSPLNMRASPLCSSNSAKAPPTGAESEPSMRQVKRMSRIAIYPDFRPQRTRIRFLPPRYSVRRLHQGDRKVWGVNVFMHR